MPYSAKWEKNIFMDKEYFRIWKKAVMACLVVQMRRIRIIN